MKENLIYLKAEKHNVVMSKSVSLCDVATLYGKDKNLVQSLYQLKIFEIHTEKECKFIFSILRVIQLINEKYPEIDLVNIGESDFIVEYKIEHRVKIFIEYIKTIFVSLTIFLGSAFSIMTFNEDVSITKVFDLVYKIVMGNDNHSSGLLEVSYAIGLPIGIILFFNHFSKFKLHNDPTPIQIEMRLYENDVNETLITNANREGNTIDCD